jgi:hypothetical protein
MLEPENLISTERKFLFRCENCGMIVSAAFSTDEDFIKLNENLIDLQCACEGVMKVLRD